MSEKTAVSVSLQKKLLDQIDQRAGELEMNRSQYLCQLAKADINKGGPINALKPEEKDVSVEGIARMLHQHFGKELMPFDLDDKHEREIYDWVVQELKLLEALALQSLINKETADFPQEFRPPPAETFKTSPLYKEFTAEREEILKYKWLESQSRGFDIGMEKALIEWCAKHRRAWLEHYRKNNGAT